MFDQVIADEICAKLSTNAISLDAVLSADGMPKKTQVYEWLKTVPKFAEDYARARESQADTDADEIANVRDLVTAGKLSPEQGRVAIDSLKWSAGKRKPKVYGDRLDLNHDGALAVTIVDAIARRVKE